MEHVAGGFARVGQPRRRLGGSAAAYLHSGLSQIDFESQLLSGVDVRVVCLSKNPLQLLQLSAGEGGPDAPLLSLLVQSPVIREKFVGNWNTKEIAPSGASSSENYCRGGAGVRCCQTGENSDGTFDLKSSQGRARVGLELQTSATFD